MILRLLKENLTSGVFDGGDTQRLDRTARVVVSLQKVDYG
jgi:hypothetical protein